jgi:hypothetical protein
MSKKKKKYQKPEITSERLFEEAALQCTATGNQAQLNVPMLSCQCVLKVQNPSSVNPRS